MFRLQMDHPMSLLAVILAVLSFTSPSSAAQCYHLDGSRADDTHQPCNPDAEVSACCALNKHGPDVCLSSGLCYSQDLYYRGLVYSNGCTDPTGESEECPHFCPDRRDDWNDGPEVEVWNIFQCNAGGESCCRASDDHENCCDDSTAVETFNIGTVVLPSSTASPSASPSTSEPPSTSETPSCPAGQVKIVGGAVGGALGGVLLASLVGFVILWKRKPARQEQHPQASESKTFYQGQAPFGGHSTIQELEARPGISELRGD